MSFHSTEKIRKYTKEEENCSFTQGAQKRISEALGLLFLQRSRESRAQMIKYQETVNETLAKELKVLKQDNKTSLLIPD